MIILAVSLAVAAAVALAFLAWPLLRRRADSHASAYRATLATSLLLLSAAAGLYLLIGNPHGIDASPAADDRLRALQAAAHEKPHDTAAWLALGDAYVDRANLPLAQQAFQRANDLAAGGSAEALAGMGEILMQSGDPAADARALALFNAALKLQPEQPKSLFFSALLLMRMQQPAQARSRLARMLRPDMPADIRNLLQRQIAALDTMAGSGNGQVKDEAAAADTRLHLRVSVAPELAHRLPKAAALFVFVRGADAGGPPLAARRLPANLPASIDLSAADAMIAGRGLSPGQQVTVAARLSLSGNPIAASGDAFGEASAVVGKSGVVDVQIDRVQP